MLSFGKVLGLVLALATSIVASDKRDPQVEFSAVVVQTTNHETTRHKLFVGKTRMRLERDGGADDQPVIILDFADSRTFVLMPRDKSFMELTSSQRGLDDRMVFLNHVDPAHPCSAVYSGIEHANCSAQGTEDLRGRPTQKYSTRLPDGRDVNLWTDAKLSFVVKLQLPESAMELQNITEAPQDSALFGIPLSYTRASFGPVQKDQR